MLADREKRGCLLVAATLAVAACSGRPMHGLAARDAAVTSSDLRGGREPVDARGAEQEVLAVAADVRMEQVVPRDSAGPDIAMLSLDARAAVPEAPSDAVVIPVDAARDIPMVPDSKEVGPEIPSRVDARANATEVAADRGDVGASLMVSSTSLDFGTVGIGFSRVMRVTITNLGQEASGALVLGSDNSEFRFRTLTDGDCVFEQTILASGASCTVALVFTPSRTLVPGHSPSSPIPAEGGTYRFGV